MKSFVDVFSSYQTGFQDVDYDNATIKNEYGEKIHIKFENDRIYIHHEDATDDFVTLEDFFKKYILNPKEVIDIELTIKKIYFKNEYKDGKIS